MKEDSFRQAKLRNCYSNRLSDHSDHRQAMTLVELLLVLVLLVVVGSLAAPIFEGTFAAVRLRRGTDQVLATWSQARTYAIESGYIYQFRFKPEGNTYRIEPWTGGLELDEQEIEAEVAATGMTAAEAELRNFNQELTLPDDVVFSEAVSASTDQQGSRQIERLDVDESEDWSIPILFFPDGTTSEASLLLKNNKEIYRRATLRSLTGVGRASDLMSREEVDRNKSR